MKGHSLKREDFNWRNVLITGFVVLHSANWAVSEPTYEVPHPALSRAAISDGKGRPRFQVLI